jgi:hypothetical protein
LNAFTFNRHLILEKVKNIGFMEKADPNASWFEAFERYKAAAGMLPEWIESCLDRTQEIFIRHSENCDRSPEYFHLTRSGTDAEPRGLLIVSSRMTFSVCRNMG